MLTEINNQSNRKELVKIAFKQDEVRLIEMGILWIKELGYVMN